LFYQSPGVFRAAAILPFYGGPPPTPSAGRRLPAGDLCLAIDQRSSAEGIDLPSLVLTTAAAKLPLDGDPPATLCLDRRTVGGQLAGSLGRSSVKHRRRFSASFVDDKIVVVVVD